MHNVNTLRISNRTSVFKTPWFELVAKSVEDNSMPHYSIRTRDYVSVFAITRDKTFVLVRQFRPAIEMFTLELPAVFGMCRNSTGFARDGASTSTRFEESLVAKELEFIVAHLLFYSQNSMATRACCPNHVHSILLYPKRRRFGKALFP